MSDASLLAFLKEVILTDADFVSRYRDRIPNELILSPASPLDPFEKGIVSPRHSRATSPALSSHSSLPDQEMAEASASESDAIASSSSSSDDYTVVGKKRARKARKPAASIPAKAPRTQEETSPSVLTPPTPSPRSRTDRTPSPTPKSPASAPAPKKAPTPPPLFIHDKCRWTEVSKLCVERRINFTHARATQVGIKVQVPSAADFRSLTSLLKGMKIQFHTYALPEDRLLRVVVRNIPKEISSADILADLKSHKIPAIEVHRMHRGRNSTPYDMVLAICELSPAGKAIFNIKSICNLSGIKIEPPLKNGPPGQCHRCQLYGHSQRNCFAKPRCVKCLGDHATADCARPKDRAQCAEPPSCVLCGETGHPANYRGCPKAPRTTNKVAKRAETRERFAAPSTTLPNRLEPQRPSPWNALNHQRSFPALRPNTTAAIPPLMGTPIAPPTPSSRPAAPLPSSASAPAVKQVPSPHPNFPILDRSTVISAMQRLCNPTIFERMTLMMERAISCERNPGALLGLMFEFQDVTDHFLNFRVFQ